MLFLLEFARKAIQKGNMPFEYKSRLDAGFPCVDKLTDCRETSEGLRSKMPLGQEFSTPK